MAQLLNTTIVGTLSTTDQITTDSNGLIKGKLTIGQSSLYNSDLYNLYVNGSADIEGSLYLKTNITASTGRLKEYLRIYPLTNSNYNNDNDSGYKLFVDGDSKIYGNGIITNNLTVGDSSNKSGYKLYIKGNAMVSGSFSATNTISTLKNIQCKENGFFQKVLVNNVTESLNSSLDDDIKFLSQDSDLIKYIFSSYPKNEYKYGDTVLLKEKNGNSIGSKIIKDVSSHQSSTTIEKTSTFENAFIIDSTSGDDTLTDILANIDSIESGNLILIITNITLIYDENSPDINFYSNGDETYIFYIAKDIDPSEDFVAFMDSTSQKISFDNLSEKTITHNSSKPYGMSIRTLNHEFENTGDIINIENQHIAILPIENVQTVLPNNYKSKNHILSDFTIYYETTNDTSYYIIGFNNDSVLKDLTYEISLIKKKDDILSVSAQNKELFTIENSGDINCFDLYGRNLYDNGNRVYTVDTAPHLYETTYEITATNISPSEYITTWFLTKSSIHSINSLFIKTIYIKLRNMNSEKIYVKESNEKTDHSMIFTFKSESGKIIRQPFSNLDMIKGYMEDSNALSQLYTINEIRIDNYGISRIDYSKLYSSDNNTYFENNYLNSIGVNNIVSGNFTVEDGYTINNGKPLYSNSIIPLSVPSFYDTSTKKYVNYNPYLKDNDTTKESFSIKENSTNDISAYYKYIRALNTSGNALTDYTINMRVNIKITNRKIF